MGCFFLRYLKEFLWLYESGFEGAGGEADIGFVRFVVISAAHCGLVYHRFLEALAETWTFVGFSSVSFVHFW